MVNTEKAVKRDRTRMIKGQNPQQIDFKRMRKAREAKTKYWALKKKAQRPDFVAVVEDKKKPKKEKKVKKPELEVVQDEPELEIIDEELDEIFSLDDEELEDDIEDEVE
ncbi:MAG: hypothetical protein P1Q69_06855 [Candidatus Thorarchaeota archaeon]|nr:hypothetical protein [Candidatus Thorarchaeota archaeon]